MNWVKGRDKNRILDDMTSTSQVGSSAHEQQKAGIIVRCTEDLEVSLKSLRESMEESSRQAGSLSKRVFWLNVAIAVATVLGVTIELIKLFRGN